MVDTHVWCERKLKIFILWCKLPALHQWQPLPLSNFIHKESMCDTHVCKITTQPLELVSESNEIEAYILWWWHIFDYLWSMFNKRLFWNFVNYFLLVRMLQWGTFIWTLFICFSCSMLLCNLTYWLLWMLFTNADSWQNMIIIMCRHNWHCSKQLTLFAQQFCWII